MKIYRVDERKDLEDQIDRITDIAWPEFMLHDDYANEYFGYLYAWFPEFQFIMVENDKVVGLGNSIPISWDKELDELPERGWDWAIEHGITNRNHKFNLLCGLQVVIDPDEQGRGLSKLMVREMIRLSKQHKFDKLVLPVRPSHKSMQPAMSIDEYIRLQNSDGYSTDAWLRTHQKEGGRIIKPCHEAMLIKGTISQWEEWTGITIKESGSMVVPGALTEVEFNLQNDMGIYLEPNVWMVHDKS